MVVGSEEPHTVDRCMVGYLDVKARVPRTPLTPNETNHAKLVKGVIGFPFG